jgi:glycosyltransferase involved in cell wall biosynthesis
MKMLTVIHLYPPHHLGGYEVACQSVMERFAERGIEVEVLTADHQMAGVEEVASPFPVRRVLRGWWDWDAWAPVQVNFRERLAVERHNQRALRQAVAEFQPDVASVWDLGMMSWSLATLLERRRIPIVLTFLDDWITFAYVFDAWSRIFDKRPWLRPFGAALGLETRLPTFRGAIASNASRMIEHSVATNSRWKFPEAELIPMGVENRSFPISEPRQGDWSWRLMFSGRLVHEKGVATVIKALSRLPEEATLDLVGHGHESIVRELEDLAAELGVADRVSFGVASSRQDLRDRYRAADLVVFASEWPEPFGLVPLEAMACGTPVVATGTGGSGEFLDDEVNCLRFTPGDPESMAAAILRVAQDPALRSRLVSGGTATVQRMTMDGYADQLEVLHRRAASGGSKQAAA